MLLVAKLRADLLRVLLGVGHPADVCKAAVEKRAVLDNYGANDGLANETTDNLVYGIREVAAADLAPYGDHEDWAFDVAVGKTRLTDCACVSSDHSESYDFPVKVVER